MANFERGSTDDDVPAFDGGEDDESEGSHLPIVIVISILVLAAFGGVVWLAYNQGVARGRNDAPSRGIVQEAQNSVSASSDAGTPRQIKIYQQPASPTEGDDVAPAAAQQQSATVAPRPAPPALRPQARESSPPTSKGAPAQEQQAGHGQIAAATSAMRPTSEAPPVATAPPAQLGLAVKAPKSSSGLAGTYALQIGAYKSQEEAMAAWKSYRAKHGILLSGLGPDVQRADLGSKGIWYRLRVGGFADKAAATSLCDRLKAESGACFLVK
ncbi:MAG: SPOR domain-containing protein [Alphaproteobacteria bacterium]|nr:SPOR domain-containing protein [Alphaproteobacteria bacterium]